MMDTQNSTLRIHTPHSGFPHSNTLSFECRLLSIRHKSGAMAVIQNYLVGAFNYLPGILYLAPIHFFKIILLFIIQR